MVEPKYKIGDILIHKLAGKEESRMFVEQIETATCSAGTQIFYIGKIWTKQYGDYKSLTRNQFKFNEIEIAGKDMTNRIDNLKENEL